MTPKNAELLRHCVVSVDDDSMPEGVRSTCMRLMGWLVFAAWRGGHADAAGAVSDLLAPGQSASQRWLRCDDLAKHISNRDFESSVLWASCGIDVSHDLANENAVQ